MIHRFHDASHGPRGSAARRYPALSRFASEPVPHKREDETEQGAQCEGKDDQLRRSSEGEGRDGNVQLNKVKPEDEIQNRLSPSKRNDCHPHEMIKPDHGSD
jgi:hypothetical protein